MPPRDFETHKNWRVSGLGVSTPGTHPSGEKALAGDQQGKKHFGGLSWFRGSQSGGPHNDKKFGPLVCHIQVGGGGGQGQAHLRLQGHKSVLGSKTFQVGPPPKHFSILEKGTMGSKNQFKGCLFSSVPGEKFEALHPPSGWRRGLGISGSLFRVEHSATKVYGIDEGFRKIWRKRGITCFVYLDDILVVGNTPKEVQKNLVFMVKTLVESGMKINLKKSVLETSRK